VASVSGTKVVALFGPTSPSRWRPAGKDYVIVDKKIECSPCNFKKMKSCKNNLCMKAIQVEEVYKKLKEILKK
ncbi:MAG: glycosyltransferase family 9 protein, partial [Endomicrobiia bacterium]